MTRKNATKRRVDDILEIGKAAPQAGENRPLAAEDVLLLAMAYEKPVNMVFEKLGYNIENIEHWMKALIFLCAAIYGKGRGQPTMWSWERCNRLLKDIADVRAAHPKYSELMCCLELVRRSPERKYDGISNAQTLRRAFQSAKKWKELSKRINNLARKGKGPMDILKAGQLKRIRSPKL